MRGPKTFVLLDPLRRCILPIVGRMAAPSDPHGRGRTCFRCHLAGCGWGGFSTYAAKNFKSKIDAITISKAQFEYASKDVGDIYDFIEVRWSDKIKRIIVKGDIFADQDNPKNKIKGDGTSIGKNRNDRPNEIDYPVLRRIEKERSINDLLPQIKEIELIKSGKHSLTFAWPHPEKDDRLSSEFALDYVIETRVHRYDAEKKSISFFFRYI